VYQTIVALSVNWSQEVALSYMKVGDPWYSVYFVMQLCFILKQE